MFRVRFDQFFSGDFRMTEVLAMNTASGFSNPSFDVEEGTEGMALETFMGDDGPVTEVELNDGRIFTVPSEILINLDG